MGLNQTIGLLGRVIADTNRIGYDAVAEHLGGALPLYPSSVASAKTLNQLLAEHGTLFPQAATATNLMDLHIVARRL